jgi:pimeloyl-ACP methyl ester carboxylesterase
MFVALAVAALLGSPPTSFCGDLPSRRITVAPNEVLAVTVRGAVANPSAPRLVLLPPVMGSAFSMRGVTEALVAQGYAVAVIDALGMGESSSPVTADYSFGAQAQRVFAVLDSLGWHGVVVAGHATSATLAFHMAALRPDRVRGVVAIAGGAVSSQHTDGVQLAVKFAPIVDTPPGRMFARRTVEKQLRERSANSAWLTPAVLAAYVAPWESQLTARLRAVAVMSATAEPTPIEAVLTRVQCPVLALLGEGPAKGMPTDVEIARLRAGIPAVRIERLKGAGAMLPEEAPAVVAAAIDRLARALVR